MNNILIVCYTFFFSLKLNKTMSNTVTIKGQPWIYENTQILQDQTLITTNGTSENTVVLLEDIWDDLLSNNGTWKQGTRPGYFYWEFKQTNMDNSLQLDGTYVEINIKVECPRPKPDLLNSFFPAGTSPKDWGDDATIDTVFESDWARYWAKEFRDADANYFKTGSLQKKVVSFVTKEKINYDPTSESFGDVTEETTVTEYNCSDFGNLPNDNTGDNLITDLLRLF